MQTNNDTSDSNFTATQKKYLKLQKVSEGSYGVVYKGRNIQTQQTVAIKKFKKITNQGIPVSCIRQLHVLNLLKNCQPEQVERTLNLVEIYHYKDNILMVTEWLDLTLRDLTTCQQPESNSTQGHLPSSTPSSFSSSYKPKFIFQSVAKSLQQLHQQCIIHRDLKPLNIMINNSNSLIKIIDYGMARQQEFDNRIMTNEVGSLYYRAPQLLLGETRYSFEIDIWSLGCVFYQILTKKILFKGDTQVDQLAKILAVVGLETADQTMIKRLQPYEQKYKQANWKQIEDQIENSNNDSVKSAIALLKSMLSLNRKERPSVGTILSHEYFSQQQQQK